MIPIIDSHLDLSWCALSWNRDLTQPLDKVRERESGQQDHKCRAKGTVSLHEMRRGNVAVCLGTILTRSKPEFCPTQGYRRLDLDHVNQTVAYAVGQGQLAYYRQLERDGEIVLLRTANELRQHWKRWIEAPDRMQQPVGLILSMEGADPIITPDRVYEWWEQGLRVVGLTHYARSPYGFGTGVSGPLADHAYTLLDLFAKLGMILDVTHLCDECFWQALDRFPGPVLASHHNCRALVPGDRQLADEQIKTLLQRDAVIGMALDAWMLYPGWKSGETQPSVVGLDAVVDHIDHICQMAGNTNHVAIGSDLDGGFGYEQTPHDLQSIADLQKLSGLLSQRGYADDAIRAIFHGNWLRFFDKHLPA